MGDSIFRLTDALLNGDSDTKDEPTPGIASDSDIRPYDPTPSVASCERFAAALEILTSVSHASSGMGLFNPAVPQPGYYRGCHTYSAVSRICA